VSYNKGRHLFGLTTLSYYFLITYCIFAYPQIALAETIDHKLNRLQSFFLVAEELINLTGVGLHSDKELLLHRKKSWAYILEMDSERLDLNICANL
jgi:phage-related holin